MKKLYTLSLVASLLLASLAGAGTISAQSDPCEDESLKEDDYFEAIATESAGLIKDADNGDFIQYASNSSEARTGYVYKPSTVISEDQFWHGVLEWNISRLPENAQICRAGLQIYGEQGGSKEIFLRRWEEDVRPSQALLADEATYEGIGSGYQYRLATVLSDGIIDEDYLDQFAEDIEG